MDPLHGLAHALKNAAEAQKQKGNHGKAVALKVAAAATVLLKLLRR